MHTIRCEIDTEYRDAEALADLAWRWLVEGAERLEGSPSRRSSTPPTWSRSRSPSPFRAVRPERSGASSRRTR
ncbi:hypothetical protein ACFQ0M_36840 [Kitasatospora aburaviensis]